MPRPLSPRPQIPLAEWASRFLPAYFRSPPSALHNWLVPELEALHSKRGSMLNVVAPRGSAKSTWVSFAYPLRAALEKREPYIVLLSDSGDQARAYLESIRMELEDNAELEAAYPDACGKGPVWQAGRLLLRNGVRIEALGTGGRIRGRKNRHQRPTLVILDDVQDKEAVHSALQRDRDWQWLMRSVLPVGQEGLTNFLSVGTALHREAVVMRLTTPRDGAGWRSQVFRSLAEMPARMDLWREWEAVLTDPRLTDLHREENAAAFYARHKVEMDAGAVALWPESFPLELLMRKRATMGPAAFASEYQSDPVNPEDCEWPAEWFDYDGIWFDKWPDDLVVKVLALDPSKGADSKSGDFSAYIRYGLDKHGNEYIEGDLRRRNAKTIVDDGIEHLREFNPDAFVIETNTFQELFQPLFKMAMAKAGILFTTYGICNAAPAKEVRIRRLTGSLAARRMRFKARSAGTQETVSQMKDFPNAEHDDGPDCTEQAQRMARWLLRGKGAKPLGAGQPVPMMG